MLASGVEKFEIEHFLSRMHVNCWNQKEEISVNFFTVHKAIF